MSNSKLISGCQAWHWQCFARAALIRVSRAHFLIWVVCASGFTQMACKGSSAPPNAGIGPIDTRPSTSTTPPFSTREPDRYQAIRITTFTGTGSTGNLSSSQTNRVLIARDGEKRREEYSAGASGPIVYLEIPAGRFVVLPINGVYAELNDSRDTDQVNHPTNAPDDSVGLSPDQLLNQAHAPATYEKLGTETIAGRPTTKYRVVVINGADRQNETLIWVDEGLGLPVKSEATSKSSGQSSSVTTELKDVKLEVDLGLFSWPSEYRKVAAGLIFNLIQKEEKPAAAKQEQK